MELTSQAVQNVLEYVLFKTEEEGVDACLTIVKDDTDRKGAVIVEGIMSNFGFHPKRLEEKKAEIIALLNELPDSFHEGKGGGMSFLNACNDKTGRQWGEHRSMELLFVLGMAIGKVKLCLPRKMWTVLPGGMPYYAVLK